jgi:hypothetical protein
LLATALLGPAVSAGAQTGPDADDDLVCVEALRAMRILIDPLANDSIPTAGAWSANATP